MSSSFAPPPDTSSDASPATAAPSSLAADANHFALLTMEGWMTMLEGDTLDTRQKVSTAVVSRAQRKCCDDLAAPACSPSLVAPSAFSNLVSTPRQLFFRLSGLTLSYYTDKEQVKGVIPLHNALLRDSHRRGMEAGFELVVNPSASAREGSLLLDLQYLSGASPPSGNNSPRGGIASSSLISSALSDPQQSQGEEQIYYFCVEAATPTLALLARREWISALQNNIAYECSLRSWIGEREDCPTTEQQVVPAAVASSSSALSPSSEIATPLAPSSSMERSTLHPAEVFSRGGEISPASSVLAESWVAAHEHTQAHALPVQGAADAHVNAQALDMAAVISASAAAATTASSSSANAAAPSPVVSALSDFAAELNHSQAPSDSHCADHGLHPADTIFALDAALEHEEGLLSWNHALDAEVEVTTLTPDAHLLSPLRRHHDGGAFFASSSVDSQQLRPSQQQELRSDSPPVKQSDELTQLFVSDHRGRTHVTSMLGDGTGLELSERISSMTRVPSSALVLTCHGKSIHPSRTLAAQSICDGDTVRLSLRLLGGASEAKMAYSSSSTSANNSTETDSQYRCKSCHASFDCEGPSGDHLMSNVRDSITLSDILTSVDKTCGDLLQQQATGSPQFAWLTCPLTLEIKCPRCTKKFKVSLEATLSRVEISKDGKVLLRKRIYTYEVCVLGRLEVGSSKLEIEDDDEDQFSVDMRAIGPELTKPLDSEAIKLYAGFWRRLDRTASIEITRSDMRLLLDEKAVIRLFRFLQQCEEDPTSGCWRRATLSSTAYTAVMTQKEAWAEGMANIATADRRQLIFAHPNLPELRDTGRGHAIVRHHPFRCELFHQWNEHGRCCRPSHLAWGSDDANKADLAARKDLMVHLFGKGFKGDLDMPRSLAHLDYYANEFIRTRGKYKHPDALHEFAEATVIETSVSGFLAALYGHFTDPNLDRLPKVEARLRAFMHDNLPHPDSALADLKVQQRVLEQALEAHKKALDRAFASSTVSKGAIKLANDAEQLIASHSESIKTATNTADGSSSTKGKGK